MQSKEGRAIFTVCILTQPLWRTRLQRRAGRTPTPSPSPVCEVAATDRGASVITNKTHTSRRETPRLCATWRKTIETFPHALELDMAVICNARKNTPDYRITYRQLEQQPAVPVRRLLGDLDGLPQQGLRRVHQVLPKHQI